MRISVVVTAYNFASLLPETLDSVLAQSHEDREVVVVDDASTDETPRVLDRYAKRVTVVRNERNRGVLRSMLSGVERTESDLVAFLDADDLWAREKLARVAAVFARRPDVALVSHDYRFVDGRAALVREDDGTQKELRALALAGDDAAVDRAMRRSVLEYRGHVWLGSAWTVNRRAFDVSAFARWVDALRRPELVYQDHPLATFIALTSKAPFAYVPEKLLSYRLHGGNYSSAAADVARAKRIIEKGRATAEATRALVLAYTPEDRAALRVQDARLHEYDFLRAAYERDVRAAARHFVRCARDYWSPRRALKESLRLGTLSVLGADRFFALKRRLSPA